MIHADKTGVTFEIRKYQEKDFALLAEMYDFFSPKAKFQGMPPLDGKTRQKWITKLLKDGKNYVALRDGKVIGHAVFFPDLKTRDGEYLIFVLQHFWRRGIGTRLTRTALQEAKVMGLKLIWLSVGAYNFIAIRLYKKFGFNFCEEYATESEKKMILTL
jgi:ribosomal protein S18 acetylase RimI-like enzyme